MNQNRLFNRVLIGLLVGVWTLGAGYGLHTLYAYSTKPGPSAEAPRQLIEAQTLGITPNASPALLMFIHPQCPCTRASLRELERLQAELATASLDVVVVVMTGEDPRLRLDAGLGRIAQAMRAVRVIDDPNGQLASRFGIQTSGQTLLYDAAGELRFAGGITPSRGHEGDSRGGNMIRQIVLDDARSEDALAPVFGCAIQSERDTAMIDGRDDTGEAALCCKQ
ncbi:MAG: hypothetical protein WD118_11040 [Phycisphaeraceae bacterium]